MKDLYANLEKLMTIRDALIITFGWLLGLLAPAITNAIKDRRELNVVKIALLAELRELQYNLVLIAFRIESRYGTLDHTFLNWVKNILNKYVGINSTEKISKTIETLLKLKAEELATSHERKKQTEAGSSLSFRKLSLPLLDSSSTFIVKFDTIFRNQLLDIKKHLGYINEISEEAKYYFSLSFQKDISPENYNIANTNLIAQSKKIETQARYIITAISEILDKEN